MHLTLTWQGFVVNRTVTVGKKYLPIKSHPNPNFELEILTVILNACKLKTTYLQK